MVSAAVIASGYSGNSKHHQPQRLAMALGVVLVLLSQLLQAVQLLTDQGYLTGRVSLSPLKVVGAEGTLGVLIMVRRCVRGGAGLGGLIMRSKLRLRACLQS
jgi:hypothetical protein